MGETTSGKDEMFSIGYVRKHCPEDRSHEGLACAAQKDLWLIAMLFMVGMILGGVVGLSVAEPGAFAAFYGSLGDYLASAVLGMLVGGGTGGIIGGLMAMFSMQILHEEIAKQRDKASTLAVTA